MESIVDPYNKKCSYCKKDFVASRRNRNYCCGDCKKKANNGKTANERLITRGDDYIIKRNRKILEQLFGAGKTVVEWSELQLKGFDHMKHTSRGADKDGKYTIAEFHNYSLEKLSDNKFRINKLW